MRGSSKIVWIVAIRTTRYPLILVPCGDVFVFLVEQGVPSDEELEWLSHQLENWKAVGRRLKIKKGRLTAFDNDNKDSFGKIYNMLLHWKERDGSAATYTVLHDALCHEFVNRKDLAEELCRQQHEWLLLCWLIDSFYFYFYWLFHYYMNMYPQYGYTITMWSTKSIIFLFHMGSFFCLLHTWIFLSF